MYIASFLSDADIVVIGGLTIAELNKEIVNWYSISENAFSDNADNIVVYQLVQTSAGPKLEQFMDFYVNLIPQIAEG